jgi:hypothetical protein
LENQQGLPHNPRNPVMTKKWRRLTGILTTNLFLIILSVAAVGARPTTAAQAKLVVENWLALGRPPLGETLGREVREIQTFPNVGNPLYYVVYLNPGGLVIVPGDDLVEPIIGFLGAGLYDPSESNPLGALVSRDIPGRVLQARALEAKGHEALAPETTQAVAQRKWAWLENLSRDLGGLYLGLPNISEVRVEPFVQSKWAQDTVNGENCYNYFTPNKYRCGCIATAMAQLMRYHQHPTMGVGRRILTIRVDWVEQPAQLRGGNGEGGPYDWGNMVLDPKTSGVNANQRQAIGALTFDAGVSVNMNYRSDGVSTSDSSKAAGAFVDVFKYSQAKYGYNDGNTIPLTNLYAMANPNLDQQYPVHLGLGGSGAIGHAVLTDGYGYDAGTMYHHLNLGWADDQSAWYNLPNVDSSPFYTTIHTCVYNVFKDGAGEIISGRVTTSRGNPISGATITANRTGGGAYTTTTTNAKGIYALAPLPSASTYRLTVAKANYTFLTQTVATGTTTDNTIITGNLWGINFTGASTRKPFSAVYQLLLLN